MYHRNSLFARILSLTILTLSILSSVRASAASTGTIAGKVTDTLDQALQSVTVVVGNVTTWTDVNGNYTARAVPTGTQILTGSKALYSSASLSLSVVAGSTVFAPTLKLTSQQASPPPVALPPAAPPSNPGVFKITGVASNLDSVKVRYTPVQGASDYRIYDVNDPTTVKYAGIWYLYAPYGYHFLTDNKGNPLIPDQTAPNTAAVTGPTVIGVPATEIEMNGLTPGTPYTLVVEAVNALGPICQGSLYNVNSVGLFARLCAMCQLGSNMGCTGDGNMTTNGQGAKDNTPLRIASANIQVTPTGLSSLPSVNAASQVLFDTFDSGVIVPVGSVDNVGGIERFSLATPAATWEIRTENADTLNSKVFVMNKHFMDILFDGGTPGTNNPLHVGHGVISLSPVKTVDFSGGKILHLTQEVDAHLGETARRWVDFRLTPANDPYLFLETTGRINSTDTDLMVQIFGPNITLDEHLGPVDRSNANSAPIGTRVVGAAGQGTYADSDRPGQTTSSTLSNYWSGKQGYQNGRGLDNRSRFDLFVSQTHFAVYEDGIKISEHDLSRPLPFTAAKVYFSHYHYHSALEVQELAQSAPWEAYWRNLLPYSDERHWDNMGFEVLPAATNWATLSATVQPPAFK